MKKKLKGRKHPEMLPARNWHPSTLGPMVGYELRIQVTFTLYEQRRRPLNNGCQIPRNKKWGVPAILRAHTRRFPPSNLALPKLKLYVASRPSVVLPKILFPSDALSHQATAVPQLISWKEVHFSGVFRNKQQQWYLADVL